MKRTEVQFCPYCGSGLETKYVEGRDRKVCRDCNSIYYINPLPAATALVLNEKNQLLLGKRLVEPGKGQWCLPGGFVELDESMDQTALRELEQLENLRKRLRFSRRSLADAKEKIQRLKSDMQRIFARIRKLRADLERAKNMGKIRRVFAKLDPERLTQEIC